MLELKSIHKNFGDFHAVEGVSLTIQEGEFFSLLGPSGCGKTTLLRLLAGFEMPTSGEIIFDGWPFHTFPAHFRPFNMVFQRYALFPHLSVYENVAFGLKIKQVRAEDVASRTQEALEMVKMWEFAKRSVTTLSGGQQQRVALARALVNRPRILLLDEPLSALDLKLRHQMQSELVHLQKQLKITFIFVTHDQDEALSLSDRIAVMNKGRVEQIGTPRDIYEHPQTSFVADFIGTTNRLPSSNGKELLIRPEKLSLSPTSTSPTSQAAAANHLPGTVTGVLFKGPMTQVVFKPDSPSSGSLHIYLNESGGTKPWCAGDRAFVSWNPQDVLLTSTPGTGPTK